MRHSWWYSRGPRPVKAQGEAIVAHGLGIPDMGARDAMGEADDGEKEEGAAREVGRRTQGTSNHAAWDFSPLPEPTDMYVMEFNLSLIPPGGEAPEVPWSIEFAKETAS